MSMSLSFLYVHIYFYGRDNQLEYMQKARERPNPKSNSETRRNERRELLGKNVCTDTKKGSYLRKVCESFGLCICAYMCVHVFMYCTEEQRNLGIMFHSLRKLLLLVFHLVKGVVDPIPFNFCVSFRIIISYFYLEETLFVKGSEN